MTSSVIFLFLFKPIISIILYELVSQRFVVIKNLSITWKKKIWKNHLIDSKTLNVKFDWLQLSLLRSNMDKDVFHHL